jgi:hypothetical protein
VDGETRGETRGQTGRSPDFVTRGMQGRDVPVLRLLSSEIAQSLSPCLRASVVNDFHFETRGQTERTLQHCTTRIAIPISVLPPKTSSYFLDIASGYARPLHVYLIREICFTTPLTRLFLRFCLQPFSPQRFGGNFPLNQ